MHFALLFLRGNDADSNKRNGILRKKIIIASINSNVCFRMRLES